MAATADAASDMRRLDRTRECAIDLIVEGSAARTSGVRQGGVSIGLRLANDERQAEAFAEPPTAVPAGTGAGVADPDNPYRIDSFAAIAARLEGEARLVFEEAVRTLRSLEAGREEVEAKLRETGREDAIRTVTGMSAIDGAIERTQAMIRALGDLR